MKTLTQPEAFDQLQAHIEDQAHRASIRSFDTHAPLPDIAATETRHVAGQAVMANKKLALLMSLAVQVDERGLDSAIALLVVSARFPKGK